jgi:hypothetical protein
MFGINQKTQLNLKIGLWWSILTLAIIVGGVGLFSPAEAMAQEGIAATETPGKMAPATQGNAFVEPPAVMAAETIAFSQNSVVTGQPFQLTMDSPVGGTIRYTTNGSPPQADSAPYTGAIPINTTTIIRAQVFDDHGAPEGNLFTRSYIIADYDPTIPVISIVTDWANLNALHDIPPAGVEWERPIDIEYFAPGGESQFNVNAGIRIHGHFSRLYSPKKSYRIYFRSQYGGPGKLDYPLFADTPVTKFDKLVLRAGFNDSFIHGDFPGVSKTGYLQAKYIGDQVVRNLHRDMGQPIAHGSWVLLYLNGQFWGLYNLTERIDTEFLQSYSDKDSQWDVITTDNGWDEKGNWYDEELASEGNYGGWLDNQNWVGSADFTNPGNIGELEWRVDMENVFSYMFLQAYVQHARGWPGNNWIVYQRTDAGADINGNERKWRMMVWDAEYTFGNGADGKMDVNTIEKVYSPHDSITRILEKPFIGFCGFKHQFVDRSREYLGVENKSGKPAGEVGQLSKERVKAEIIKQANIVRPFIQMETDRWAPDVPGVAIFEQNIANMLTFVEVRQEVILHHLDICGTRHLRVQVGSGIGGVNHVDVILAPYRSIWPVNLITESLTYMTTIRVPTLIINLVVAVVAVLFTLGLLEIGARLWLNYLASPDDYRQYALYEDIDPAMFRWTTHHYLNYSPSP